MDKPTVSRSELGWIGWPVKMDGKVVGYLNSAWEAECGFGCGVIFHGVKREDATDEIHRHYREVHDD